MLWVLLRMLRVLLRMLWVLLGAEGTAHGEDQVSGRGRGVLCMLWALAGAAGCCGHCLRRGVWGLPMSCVDP